MKSKKRKNINNNTVLLSLGAVATFVLMVFLFVKRGQVPAIDSRNSDADPITNITVVESTSEPTSTPEPTPTPEPKEYLLSFIGDNTLQSNVNYVNSPYGFAALLNGDYAYPYKNTSEYFKNDEYTLTNLECTLSDKSLYSAEQFSFKAPSEYVNILVEGGVDFVTMANNHTMDFYEAGRDDTIAACESVGIVCENDNEYKIVTTPNGITLGIISGFNTFHPEDRWSFIESSIATLKESNVDLIICMFHWGQELYYSANDNQVNLAHKCVDAGVDIVYGSHTHNLQPIEEYNGSIILYSMGNWVFGGHTEPSDPDTAIIQVKIVKDSDDNVKYDSYNVIPCSITSNIDGANAKANNTSYAAYQAYNNYCPTPYSEDNEGYARVMSKLYGTFVPEKEGADYSSWWASANQ